MTTITRTPAPVEAETWLSVHDASLMLGVSSATLRRWSAAGEVEAFTTPGGHRRYALSTLKALLPPAASEEPKAERKPTVVALVAQARWVPSAQREAFAARCRPLAADENVILIRTCHRVELYVAAENFGDAPLPALPPGGVRLQDADAARHLITVAAGMDSAVMGEDQVLHQTKEALRERLLMGPLNPILDRLFQVALGAGKRSHEILGGEKRSLGDAALDAIAGVTGGIAGRRILVVGAGDMGRVTARAAQRRGARVTIASRTPAHADALAERLGASSVGLDALPVDGFDGAVVALSGPWERAAREASVLVAQRTPLVDLSSPISLPEGVRASLGDRFTSIDDLAWGAHDEVTQERRNKIGKVIADSGRDYCRWLVSREAGPAVKAMSDAAESRRQAELDWLFRRLSGLDETERALVEQMTHRLVSGILHTPMSAVRGDDSGVLARAVCELFASA